jgi:hypothetical protein
MNKGGCVKVNSEKYTDDMISDRRTYFLVFSSAEK